LRDIDSVLGEWDTEKNWLEKSRLRRNLGRIQDQVIIDQIGMAEMPLILHILKKKYGKGIKLISIENDVILRVGKRNVANMSYLAVYLHFLTISGHTLYIEGNLSAPAGLKGYAFYAKVNGKRAEVRLKDCGLDLKLGNEIYEKRTVFSMEVPLTEDQYLIDFYNKAGGVECSCARINSLRFAPVADCIKGQYCAFCGWVVRISGSQIICRRADAEEIAEYEEKYQNEIRLLPKEKADWIVNLRNRYFEEAGRRKKPVWLVMDRGSRADDNGEVFFRFLQKQDEVDSYFVIDERSRDYDRLRKIGKVIPLYSEMHYLLALLAECVISSQCNGYVENPFWENAEYFRDLYHRPYLIFLQHGVIKDDMSRTLNRFHTNFKGFVTSTEAEYRSILEYPYYYDKDTVWLTGLPVLDELKNNEQGYIVIAPTWRKELMRQEWKEETKEMVWVPAADIRLAVYYRAYRELLEDPVLKECCRKNHYRLAFKPHPLMEPYIRDIVEGTDVLWMGKETSYRDMLGMGNLMVTDYSSVAFEFAYLGKSTLYYQFDRENFFARHTYGKGYFDYVRDGFGEICTDREELVGLLAGYMENGCAVKEEYGERIRRLYPFRGGACRRLYERIRQMTSEGG